MPRAARWLRVPSAEVEEVPADQVQALQGRPRAAGDARLRVGGDFDAEAGGRGQEAVEPPQPGATAGEDQQVTTATNAYFSDAPIGQIFGTVAKGIHRTPISPYDTQIQNAFTTALTNVETKGQDPNAAFNDAIKNAKDAIGG